EEFTNEPVVINPVVENSEAKASEAKPKTLTCRFNIVKDKSVNAARPKAVVNTARPKAVVNVVQGNNVNAVKALACWGNPQTDLQDKGVIDSG
ncbi:hypothetical protein Tco_1494474, partial [Tanacetum coccineum]